MINYLNEDLEYVEKYIVVDYNLLNSGDLNTIRTTLKLYYMQYFLFVDKTAGDISARNGTETNPVQARKHPFFLFFQKSGSKQE